MDQPFTITPPAAVDGEELQFVLNVNNSARRVFWQVVTNGTTIEMPELPTGYDTEVSFPFPGAAGTAGVFTRTRLEFNEMPPLDFDFYGSQGETTPITF